MAVRVTPTHDESLPYVALPLPCVFTQPTRRLPGCEHRGGLPPDHTNLQEAVEGSLVWRGALIVAPVVHLFIPLFTHRTRPGRTTTITRSLSPSCRHTILSPRTHLVSSAAFVLCLSCPMYNSHTGTKRI